MVSLSVGDQQNQIDHNQSQVRIMDERRFSSRRKSYLKFDLFIQIICDSLIIFMFECLDPFVKSRLEEPEPKDLTPMQDVSNHAGVGHMGGLTGSPETPGKKERNSRKQCPYCNKGKACF